MTSAASTDQRLLAICFDLGDTIMDEGTEIKDASETTTYAELIPGMAQLLHDLHAQGARLALVADSRPDTPPNVLRQHGLLELFEALAISEVVGASKPDSRMFTAALDAMGIAPQDYGRVVMVGNNLERDIAGANRLGLISVFFHWNDRRRRQPATADEIPDHTVHSAAELRALLRNVETLERSNVETFKRPEIVCHKGANQVAPENTYAAAQQCIDWGAEVVEVDVWTTRDGEMVLMHDAKVDRTTDGTGHVVALTAAEIAALDAGSWFHPAQSTGTRYAGERVPVLREFLQWIKGRARVFLDVKFAHPQQLLDLLDETGMHDEVFIWSGSSEWMGLLRELDPTIALKANVGSVPELVTAKKELHPQIIEVGLDKISDALVAACGRYGIKVMIYEKKPERFADVIAWQPELVNLDHADVFMETFERWQVGTLERSDG
ncbi:MAG: HAD-IA family hydrolase [Anaerolineae bacterium]|nr:HAD-IA family hydrolase [Anaerolineae bacterium]